jgi:hypothetical protein
VIPTNEQIRLTFALKRVPTKTKVSLEQLYVFRSYQHHWRHGTRKPIYPRNPGEASPHHICDIARAISAAPFYFDPMSLSDNGSPVNQKNDFKKSRRHHNTFIDAGFSPVNNPAEEAYHEVTTFNEPIGTFVSVGTARRLPDRSGSGFGNRVKGGLEALGDTEDVHIRMNKEATSEGKEFSYYRFNQPNALSDVDLDEWKPRSSGRRTLDKMDAAFNRWAVQPDIQAQFQLCALELVRRRRLRTSDASRWERFALGSYFSCPEGCQEEGNPKKWLSRARFESHLSEVHPGIEATTNDCQAQWVYKSRPRSAPTP